MARTPQRMSPASASSDRGTLRERARRVTQVLGIARRHGLLPVRRLDFGTDAEGSARRAEQADHLRRALEKAGGGFVKIGQLFSTRDDMLPPEWTAALSQLQTQVAPAPWPEVRALVEAELGGTLERLFQSFDEVPISAASIGQVHRAVLATGIEVAVKVQRPGIEQVVRRDVDIALAGARLIMRTSSSAREAGLDEVAKQYAQDLLRQVDFGLESRNLAALESVENRSVRAGEVRLPYLFDEMSTSRVIVMEFVHGSTIASLVRSGPRPDLEPQMRAVLRSLLRQMVFDGVFHADLHPGNILIADDDGRATLVDFGSVGRLDNQLRGVAQDIVLAYLQDDNQRIADALLELAPLREGADERAFRRAFSEFLTYELGPGARIGVATVDRLLEVITPFGMQAPVDLVAAARAFAIFEGTLRTTVPDFDVIDEARTLADEQIRDRMRPGTIAETVSREVMAVIPGLRRIPRRFDRLGQQLENGELGVNVRLLADPRDRRLLRGLVRQIILGAVGITCGVIGLGYLTSPPTGGVLDPAITGIVLGGIGVVAIGAALLDSLRNRR